MTMEWDGYEEEAVAGKDEQACLYVSMDDELTVFVDEDDRIGNAESCSRYLAEGLIDKAPGSSMPRLGTNPRGIGSERRSQKLSGCYWTLPPTNGLTTTKD